VPGNGDSSRGSDCSTVACMLTHDVQPAIAAQQERECVCGGGGGGGSSQACDVPCGEGGDVTLLEGEAGGK
jgi:hypothetical protein